MEEMTIERARLIDERLKMAKQNYETKKVPSVQIPIKDSMDMLESKEINAILKEKNCGYITSDNYYVITPAGIDFLNCGGFTRMIQEQIDQDKYKEEQMKAAKREPWFRWLTILFAALNLLQLLL